MSGFLFTFLAALLAGIGARDQVTMAGLTAKLGARLSLLLIAIATAIAASAFAAWGAASITGMFPGRARMLLAAMALGLAGAEALVLRAPKPLKEPTRSLGAAGIVMLAHQLTDSVRFLVFAIAMATMAPIPAAVGGAAGSAAALTAGWLAGDDLLRPQLPLVRRGVGLLLLLVAAWLALRTFERI
jgi:hypothetical protein